MCIAIVKTKDGHLTDEQIRNFWRGNPDGGGFAFVKDGKVVIKNGYMELNRFLKHYRRFSGANPNSNFLIHMRIATAGGVTGENTHPFPINHGALIHNGSLFWTPKTPGTKSDTRLFAEETRKYMAGKTQWELRKEEIATRVGTYNKLALLFDDDSYVIVNEKEGEWYEGVWYSNKWSAPKPNTYSNTTTNYGHGYGGYDTRRYD